jgi:hypothetical protein
MLSDLRHTDEASNLPNRNYHAHRVREDIMLVFIDLERRWQQSLRFQHQLSYH